MEVGVAQLIARRPVDTEVRGSNLCTTLIVIISAVLRLECL